MNICYLFRYLSWSYAFKGLGLCLKGPALTVEVFVGLSSFLACPGRLC